MIPEEGCGSAGNFEVFKDLSAKFMRKNNVMQANHETAAQSKLKFLGLMKKDILLNRCSVHTKLCNRE
jgi:hypothetical protein